MAEWTVTWVIDSIDAEHRVEAARKARRMLLNPRSTATVFDVECNDEALPGVVAIDLDKEGSGRWGNKIDMPDLAEIICRELEPYELTQLARYVLQELAIKLRKELDQ